MKTNLTKMIMSSLAFACASVCLAAAMMFSTSATAREVKPDMRSCSVGTVKGLYLWTLDGFQNFGGNPVPKALLEGLQFNGDGTFTVPFGTVNIGGSVIDVGGSVGTYTIAADCTGTLQVANGPSFNMYIGPGAQQLWILNTGGGPGDGTGLGVGTATRLP